MDDNFIGIFFGGCVIFTGAIGFFWKLDDVASVALKRRIGLWLLDINVRENFATLPDTFVDLFDALFGLRHLSLKCYSRSCLISTLSTIIFFFLALSLVSVIKTTVEIDSGFLVQDVTARLPNSEFDIAHTIIQFIFILTIVNFQADYLSLLETRLLISKLSGNPHFLIWILILVTDIIITGIIFSLFYFLGANLELLILNSYADFMFDRMELMHAKIGKPMPIIRGDLTLPYITSIDQLIYDITSMATMQWLNTRDIIGTAVLYSTFMTSVWLWLYSISAIVVSLSQRVDLSINLLRWALNIESHPVRSLGVIAGAIAAIIYWIIAGIILVY